MGSAPGQLIDFEEALAIVLRESSKLPARAVESVALREAVGRVLGEEVAADRYQPAFDRSTRDGFAVRAAEAAGGWRIAGQIRAGGVRVSAAWAGEWASDGRLAEGAAIEIMTGAPMPEGADAVVMVEHVVCEGKQVRLGPGRVIRAGENVVARGTEARKGDVVLRRGTRMGAAEIALAATCGCVELKVFTAPTVAIVATGDELVEVGEEAGPFGVRDSNSHAIAAMVESAGGTAGRLAIARDERNDVRERVEQGRMWDLMVFSGGVSMGEYDLVEEVLAEFDADFIFTGVRLQPGKPVVFGRLPTREDGRGAGPACYFFGLPGNPISTQVTFHCFVEMFLRVMSGERVDGPRWAQATLAEEVAGKPGLTRLLPARMTGVEVSIVPWQGSGDLAANARANCYVELLPGRGYAAGEVVRVLLR